MDYKYRQIEEMAEGARVFIWLNIKIRDNYGVRRGLARGTTLRCNEKPRRHRAGGAIFSETIAYQPSVR
jgi:hypothetical protein